MEKCEFIAAEPLGLTLRWKDGVLRSIKLEWARGRTSDTGLSPLAGAMESALARYVSGEKPIWPDLPIPLDELTPFSREVLSALTRVEHGGRVSYGELARRAGRPKAARAVGRIMASNRWPLVLPCHRVLGSKGGLAGFSGAGLPMKEYLLRLESGRL